MKRRLMMLVLMWGVFAWAAELQTVEGVRLVPTDWADGDSFRVRFPNGEEHTLRLYGVDCVEWHVTNESDARRLRAQRRYFGISGHGGTSAASIQLAKSLGERAASSVRSILSVPFTVHTSFADGRGDVRFKRIYAFVTTSDGRDLGTLLVGSGNARAFGIARATPDGQSREDYRETLRDAELVAARAGRGAWQFTDWRSLPEERRQQRLEDREEQLALKKGTPLRPVDLNTASRDELMALPGVGEVTALQIIEGRPYKRVEDLLQVQGIGAKTLEKLKPWVQVER